MSGHSKHRTRLFLGGLATAAVALLASPATGDWLVTTDGSRIETDGPWTERGRTVVFESDGQLMSLRLADVDLEASRALTAEAEAAKRRPAPPPPPPRPSVLRLTDADVAHVDDDPESEEAGSPDAPLDAADGDADGEDADDSVSPTVGDGDGESGVAVTEWSQEIDDSGIGVTVSGTLENDGDGAAVGVSVVVTARDIEGDALATTIAQLGTTSLMPGETTRLIARFPDIYDVSAVDFQIRQQTFAVRASDDIE